MSQRHTKVTLSCWLVMPSFLGNTLWFEYNFTIEFCPKLRMSLHDVPSMMSLLCDIIISYETPLPPKKALPAGATKRSGNPVMPFPLIFITIYSL